MKITAADVQYALDHAREQLKRTRFKQRILENDVKYQLSIINDIKRRAYKAGFDIK